MFKSLNISLGHFIVYLINLSFALVLIFNKIGKQYAFCSSDFWSCVCVFNARSEILSSFTLVGRVSSKA